MLSLAKTVEFQPSIWLILRGILAACSAAALLPFFHLEVFLTIRVVWLGLS